MAGWSRTATYQAASTTTSTGTRTQTATRCAAVRVVIGVGSEPSSSSVPWRRLLRVARLAAIRAPRATSTKKPGTTVSMFERTRAVLSLKKTKKTSRSTSEVITAG